MEGQGPTAGGRAPAAVDRNEPRVLLAHRAGRSLPGFVADAKPLVDARRAVEVAAQRHDGLPRPIEADVAVEGGPIVVPLVVVRRGTDWGVARRSHDSQ